MPASGLARAERQFTRSMVAGIVLLGLVAVVGPVLSYSADVREIRGQFRTRIAREAAISAEALALHLQLLESELVRVGAGITSDLREVPTEDFQDLSSELGLF